MRTIGIIFLSLCALLTGCSTYNTVTVSISDASGDPVQGASVHASPMYFYNPTPNNYIIVGPYDTVEPFPAKGAAGITDESGLVSLEIVTQSPLELHVLADGHLPWKGQIAITKKGDVEIYFYPTQSKLQVSSVSETQN